MKNRQWLLARRPEGALKDSDFTFVESRSRLRPARARCWSAI